MDMFGLRHLYNDREILDNVWCVYIQYNLVYDSCYIGNIYLIEPICKYIL